MWFLQCGTATRENIRSCLEVTPTNIKLVRHGVTRTDRVFDRRSWSKDRRAISPSPYGSIETWGLLTMTRLNVATASGTYSLITCGPFLCPSSKVPRSSAVELRSRWKLTRLPYDSSPLLVRHRQSAVLRTRCHLTKGILKRLHLFGLSCCLRDFRVRLSGESSSWLNSGSLIPESTSTYQKRGNRVSKFDFSVFD